MRAQPSTDHYRRTSAIVQTDHYRRTCCAAHEWRTARRSKIMLLRGGCVLLTQRLKLSLRARGVLVHIMLCVRACSATVRRFRCGCAWARVSAKLPKLNGCAERRLSHALPAPPRSPPPTTSTSTSASTSITITTITTIITTTTPTTAVIITTA